MRGILGSQVGVAWSLVWCRGPVTCCGMELVDPLWQEQVMISLKGCANPAQETGLGIWE